MLGNHDWWYDGERVMRALNNNGIKVLENDVAQIERDGQSIWIAGLADLWTRKQLVTTTLSKISGPGQRDRANSLSRSLSKATGQRVFNSGRSYARRSGQSAVPRTPCRPFGVRRALRVGHIQENGHHLFVTPGIGTSIIPVRFRVPPEISVLIDLAG